LLADALAIALPRLDAYTQTAWLVNDAGGQPALFNCCCRPRCTWSPPCCGDVRSVPQEFLIRHGRTRSIDRPRRIAGIACRGPRLTTCTQGAGATSRRHRCGPSLAPSITTLAGWHPLASRLQPPICCPCTCRPSTPNPASAFRSRISTTTGSNPGWCGFWKLDPQGSIRC